MVETTDKSKICQWEVHKFGGTSVADASCIKNVADIILSFTSQKNRNQNQNQNQNHNQSDNINQQELLNSNNNNNNNNSNNNSNNNRLAIVVSALGGKPKVTDLLLDTVHFASQHKVSQYQHQLELIRKKHVNVIHELLPIETCEIFEQILEADLRDLRDVLRAVSLTKYAGETFLELVSGYGEMWSAQILSYYLQFLGYDFHFINARKVLFVDDRPETGPEIMWEESLLKVNHFLSSLPNRDTANLVITGFIATNQNGVATTLKRDGSDYSASIFGRLLKANKINIWTDVDGVLSADPRRVPNAKVLMNVSFNEAMELAYFGAKVIHPKTMQPAIQANIPIYIRNTFNPDFPGSKIYHSSSFMTKDRNSEVCGFSTIDNMALINVEGSGMIGVPGVAGRLFSAVHHMGVSVTLIAQASSEHSISFACKATDADAVKASVEDVFHKELRMGYISSVDVKKPCSIIAAVGDNMNNAKGVAGKFFEYLGKYDVNVLAISQGSSERNISAVVKGEDSEQALRAVHSAFLASEIVMNLCIVGTGKLGKAILELLEKRKEEMKKRFHVDLNIIGIVNSKKQYINRKGLDNKNWNQLMESEEAEISNLDTLASVLKKNNDSLHNVIIDCTDSYDVGNRHSEWLKERFHIVTANKKGVASSYESWKNIFEVKNNSKVNYRYETIIGSGLPVFSTLQKLLTSGETILQIEGAFSSSLSFIFNLISRPEMKKNENTPTFSEAFQLAMSRDLMERNPLDDLKGTEVAQKVVVLAREMGLPLELEDINVSPVLTSDSIEKLQKYDEPMSRHIEEVRKKKSVLRYIGTVKANGSASVGLAEIPFSHPYAQLQDASNCICFKTERFPVKPLMIQGPTGNSESTASTLFGDLLQIALNIGAYDKKICVTKDTEKK